MSLKKRKGRAGRVQPGESYHFINKLKYNNLDAYPLPEVLRSSLDKTVLDCKTHSNEKAEKFLGDMPQPPTYKAVNQAVMELIQMGALDENENLTSLGKRIASFTVHPKLGKAMVLSYIFDCVSPMLSIASVFSLDSEMFSGILRDKSGIRKVKNHFQPVSDHLAVAWIFAQWESYFESNEFETLKFCKANRLYPDRMQILQKVRNLNAIQLQECKILEQDENYKDFKSDRNSYANLDEIIRAVFLSATDNILKHKKFVIVNNRLKKNDLVMTTENFDEKYRILLESSIEHLENLIKNGSRGVVSPESVNYKRKIWPSPYLTYYRKTHSEERRAMLIRETSMVSPLSVLLFTSGAVVSSQPVKRHYDGNEKIELHVVGKTNIKLECNLQSAFPLLKFREMMWSVVQYFIEKQGFVTLETKSEFEKVDDFKRRMLNVLATMLNDASTSIDYPESTNDKTCSSSENNSDSVTDSNFKDMK